MSILRSISIVVLFVLVLGLIQTIDQEAYPATPEGAVRYELVFDKNAMQVCENLDKDCEITKSLKEIEKVDFVEGQNFLQYIHSQATDCEKMCFRVKKYTHIGRKSFEDPCGRFQKFSNVFSDLYNGLEEHEIVALAEYLRDLQMMCYEREALTHLNNK